jgi:hypothetical protein
MGEQQSCLQDCDQPRMSLKLLSRGLWIGIKFFSSYPINSAKNAGLLEEKGKKRDDF